MSPARRAALAAVALLLALPASSRAIDPKVKSDPFQELRRQMVDQQIRKRGITQPRLSRVMEEVPRHLFVPEAVRSSAYDDGPLPIGAGQTISQPYIVALMTSVLDLDEDDRVLEIGTGSGYQAAVLSRLVKEVYSIEIRDDLGESARRTLEELGYRNVRVRIADGYQGWPEEAPFDGIIVTAASPERVPQPLIDQLKIGGKLVVPVGKFFQELVVATRTADGHEIEEITGVRFVPMVGEVERQER